jgi:hypothetical protein
LETWLRQWKPAELLSASIEGMSGAATVGGFSFDQLRVESLSLLSRTRQGSKLRISKEPVVLVAYAIDPDIYSIGASPEYLNGEQRSVTRRRPISKTGLLGSRLVSPCSQRSFIPFSVIKLEERYDEKATPTRLQLG